MSETTTRVFHPTLRESYDILNAEVESWKDSGWMTEAPDYDALQSVTSTEEPRTGSKADLEKQAADLGLSTEGTKADLEKRITEANAQQ